MAPQANGLDQGKETVTHAATLLREGPPAPAAARQALDDLIEHLEPRTRRILQSDPELARALWLLDLAIRQDQVDRKKAGGRWMRRAIMACAFLGLIGFLLLLRTEIASAPSVDSPGERIQPRWSGNAHPPAGPRPASSVSGQPVV